MGRSRPAVVYRDDRYRGAEWRGGSCDLRPLARVSPEQIRNRGRTAQVLRCQIARIEAGSFENIARVPIRMAPAGKSTPRGRDDVLYVRAQSCAANVFQDRESPAWPQDALRTFECPIRIGYRAEYERKDDDIDALRRERIECFIACDLECNRGAREPNSLFRTGRHGGIGLEGDDARAFSEVWKIDSRTCAHFYDRTIE